MSTTAKAIVTYNLQHRQLEDIKVNEPRDDELLVDMVAAGVCHTDLSEIGAKYPCVQGHEGAGYVKAVGKNVKVAQPGDPVLLSFASCRSCHFCETKHPAFCQQFAALNFATLDENYETTGGDPKTVHGGYFGQSCFAKLTLVKESTVVNVKDLVKDKEELKLMAPLGCGVQTGSGTVSRIAQATKEDTVAVIGLGGVGLSAIMAAKVIGCKQIIAIDIVESRIELAKTLGATTTFNSKKLKEGENLVEQVQKAVEGLGPSVTVDTTGVLPVIAQAMQFTRPRGKMIQLAAAPLDQMMEVHVVSHTVFGKILMGGIEGDAIPAIAIPEMIEWWRKGMFPFDKFCKFYPVDKFQQAIDDMHSGETIKPILLW